ncbi:ALG10B [Symbiodinium natans]|uniref:ALG10B protein n=1 Tax=Symbiodinium natans TaxID=878477 RepID=A0A812LJU6_9DINO|nr:ALG10B [Symbiodinium natans]
MFHLLATVYEKVNIENTYSDHLICRSNWIPVRDSMLAFTVSRGGEYLIVAELPSGTSHVERMIFRCYASQPYIMVAAHKMSRKHKLVQARSLPGASRLSLVGLMQPEGLDKDQPVHIDWEYDAMRKPEFDPLELLLEEVQSCSSGSASRWPEEPKPAAGLTQAKVAGVPGHEAGPLFRPPQTGSEKEEVDDALQDTMSQNGLDELLPDVDNTISFADKKVMFGSKAAEACENKEAILAKPKTAEKAEDGKELPPAIMMSLAPMPSIRPADAKLKEPDLLAEQKPAEVSSLARGELPGAEDIRAIVKAEVTSQLASVFDRIDSLKKSCDELSEEIDKLKGRPSEAQVEGAKPSSEDVEELHRSVKKELFDVQQVLNSELKDLSTLLEDRDKSADEKFEALETADAQIQLDLQALRLDHATMRSALEDEFNPTMVNLTAVQRALGTAHKEVEARLNDCLARQKSDALFLNGRLKDMETGWTGLLGCFCKRRRPKEVAFRPSEFSSKGGQPQPQSIPADPERSVSLDAD